MCRKVNKGFIAVEAWCVFLMHSAVLSVLVMHIKCLSCGSAAVTLPDPN